MKKRSLMSLILAIGLVSLLGGCVFAPVVPPRGILYNDQTSPLFPGGTPGEKIGKASSHNILFLVGWGDSGMARAIENGGIQRVNHTDYRIQNYMLFYQRYTTIVHGE
ncbi:TRL-like family protein [bacterium]|nr:TRL-like family protein [bacterium]